MIKAIIFDCFGVLVGDALETIVQDISAHNPPKAERIKSLINASNKGQIDPELSRNQVASELGMTLEEYRTALRTGEIRNKQLLTTILDLHSDYKIGLLSNISSGGLAVRFTTEELTSHFDAVVASSDVGLAKPDPAIYQLTAERLGVESNECIMIDDRTDYCQGAVAAGMIAIQYVSYKKFMTDLAELL